METTVNAVPETGGNFRGKEDSCKEGDGTAMGYLLDLIRQDISRKKEKQDAINSKAPVKPSLLRFPELITSSVEGKDKGERP